MSNTPWDSGGMNKLDNYDGNVNDVQNNSVHNEHNYCDMNPTFNPGWGQNNWFPHNANAAQGNLDHLNHNSETNELSGVAFSHTGDGYNAYNYDPNYLNNQYWSGQAEYLEYHQHSQSGQFDKHFTHHDLVTQHPPSDFEANHHYLPNTSGHQEFSSRPEELIEYENIPLADDVRSSGNSLLKEEVQAPETSSNLLDQQVPPQVLELGVDSSSAEKLQQVTNVVPPPVGTMTGIPTRNQFRKGPSKKSPYLSKAIENSSSHLGFLEMFPEQKIVSPGSGDHADLVADSGSVATDESLDQKLADNEVALLNQSCSSPSSNLESSGLPVLPTKPLDELPLQSESDVKNEKEELKSVTDDVKLHQARSSDTFNASFQHISRKKPHRDSTLSPALWENVDMSPLKLCPKLVPTQEVEVASTADDDGAQNASSPLQNTGTGPSNNNLLSNPETNLASTALTDKPQTISSVVPASFPLDLSSLTAFSDANSGHPKSAFQPVNAKVEEIVCAKENTSIVPVGISQFGTMQTTSHQPSSQFHQLEQQASQPTKSEQESVMQSLHPPETNQNPHQLPQQIHRQHSIESEHQKQPVLLVPSTISDPRLSAFSTVKPTVSANNLSSIHNSSHGLGNEISSKDPGSPAANKKMAYSALNPEPTLHVKPEHPSNPKQNLGPASEDRQDNFRTPNDSQRQHELEKQPRYADDKCRGIDDYHNKPQSRQGSDSHYYSKEGPPRREYCDYPQRHQRPDSRSHLEDTQRHDVISSRSMDDPLDYHRDSLPRRDYNNTQKYQRPNSRFCSEDPPRPPYEERYSDKLSSRQGYVPEGQPGARPDLYRPPSHASEAHDDRRRTQARDYDPYGRPSSRQSAYEEMDRTDRHGHPPDRNVREDDYYGYSERSQYPDDKFNYPGDRFKYGENRLGRFWEERPRNSDERDLYADSRSRYHNDRPVHPDERQKIGLRCPERQPRYGEDRYRDMGGHYARPRSRQGYPEEHYRSRDDPASEVYNRPRSRQDDPNQSQSYYEKVGRAMYEKQYSDYMRQYYESMAYYCMLPPEQRLPMDPRYGQFYNHFDPYNRGFLQEMASYGNAGFNQSIPDMEATSSRTSSRNFNPFTAADQFARESREGSRPTSQLSGFVTGFVEEKRRLTPFKYSRCHIRATFSASGQLIQVVPNNPMEGQPAIVRILSLCDWESDEVKEVKKCPGPLVRGVHKKDVQDFCRSMSIRCKEDLSLVDRSSAQLIWDFLSLLIKQNGSIVGTDISELLVQGKDFNPSSDNNGDDDDLDSTSRSGFDRLFIYGDKHSLPDGKSDLTIAQVTNRFRELLLFGRKKDALDWAAEHHLWGHALYLASQMDAKTFASIKTKFTNVAMKDNDPLQTLYQLMSGRQPPSVSLLDERWEDWRPHLSMIISNPTPKQELDKKSVVTLGDTLASRGLLYASHFCYLVAQTIFGSINSKTPKLILIGSSQGLPLNQFATNTAIWATEVYEYALSLADPNFSLTSLVTYKFIYVIRLLDLGLFEEALKYAEVIAQSIIRNPGAHSPAIIKFISYLSTSLKMWDPQRDFAVLEGEIEQEPTWYTDLQTIVKMVQEGSIRFREGTSSPQVTSTGASSEVGEILTGDPQCSNHAANQWTNQSYQQYHQDHTLANQSNDWSNPNQTFNWMTNQQSWTNQPPIEGLGLNVQQQQEFVYNAQAGQFNTYIPPGTSATTHHSEATAFQQQQQHQHPEFTIGGSEMEKIPEESIQDTLYDHHPSQHRTSHDTRRSSRTRTVSSSSNASRKSSGVPPSGSGKYNDESYKFGTLPEVSNTTLVTDNSSTMSGMNQPLGVHGSEEKPKKKQPFPIDDPDDFDVGALKKVAPEKKGYMGWLSFLTGHKAKDVHLPDDSNPKLIWDDVKKIWVNTEEGEGGSEKKELAPPPVMQGPCAGSLEQTGVNRFARGTKPRGARAQYADVLGGSVKPQSPDSSSLLSSALPKSASMPANIFNPASLHIEDNQSTRQPGIQQEHLGVQQAHPQVEQTIQSQEPQEVPSNSQHQPGFPPQFFDPSKIQSIHQPANRQPPWMGQRGHHLR